MALIIERELMKAIAAEQAMAGHLSPGVYTLRVEGPPGSVLESDPSTWDVAGIDILNPATWIGPSNVALDNRVLFNAWLATYASTVTVDEANAYPARVGAPAFDTYVFTVSESTPWPAPVQARLGNPQPRVGRGGSAGGGAAGGGAGPIVDPNDSEPGWCDPGGRLESICGPEAEPWIPWAIGGAVVGGIALFALGRRRRSS